MSDPTCREFRELLGVYVVGAIEPAERSAVDAHLSHCYDCREDLAGIAVLPALLHRVSVADAERLMSSDVAGDDPAEQSSRMLDRLLRQVAARRKTRRLRTAFTIAAVTLAVAGGTTAVTSALAPPSGQHVPQDQAGVHMGTLAAMVRYSTSPWGHGTDMSVRVAGLPTWTRCKFWVVTKSGRRELAAAWTVGPGGERLWYPAEVAIRKSSISEFVLTTAKGTVLTIPTV